MIWALLKEIQVLQYCINNLKSYIRRFYEFPPHRYNQAARVGGIRSLSQRKFLCTHVSVSEFIFKWVCCWTSKKGDNWIWQEYDLTINDGTSVCLLSSFPQQYPVPLVETPQECTKPADIAFQDETCPHGIHLYNLTPKKLHVKQTTERGKDTKTFKNKRIIRFIYSLLLFELFCFAMKEIKRSIFT